MDKKAADTIDQYIPAAHLMVQARACTNTLNEAVEWVQQRDDSFEPGYLRLLWLGVNAQCNSKQANIEGITEFIHPDYLPEEQPITPLVSESKELADLVAEAIDDVSYSKCESRKWLGTYKVEKRTCQLQLVLTSIDTDLVDEG